MSQNTDPMRTAREVVVPERVATALAELLERLVEAAQLLGITRHKCKSLIIKHQIEWPRGYTPKTETDGGGL